MARTHGKFKSLKNGRPPLLAQSALNHMSDVPRKQSSKATRTMIRAHHNLHRSRAKAVAQGNHILLTEIDAQIEQLGGLAAYQNASLTGQSKDRGGDSSTVLVTWLEEEGLVGKSVSPQNYKSLRVLEVGALSSRNAISSMIGKGIECVKRIDLKSQESAEIEEIDFMELPIPKDGRDKFDIISLSLVLNYVPEASARGEMLRRTRAFFRDKGIINSITPCLFFVLPLPCVSNSRYLTADRLRELMATLGYQSRRLHQSAKLHYELFYLDKQSQQAASFNKVEVNPGKDRNNFCVTLTSG